jgi:cytochrome c553
VRLNISAAAAALCWVISPETAFAGDAAAGKTKVSQCAVCHGVDGVSKNPDAPNLSGQLETYLVKSMLAFKKGERKQEQMSIIAEGLEEADIGDLAAYYASIKVTVEAPK